MANTAKTDFLAEIEKKDLITFSHCTKTSHYALRIGTLLGLNEMELEDLEISAALHDIGKVNVPDAILMKPSSLTDEEYDLIKKHSVWGAQMLEAMAESTQNEAIKALAIYVRYHHERYDGNGYPEKLKGETIPLFSQIIAVADAFDAMTSDRPYRKAMSRQQAVGILQSESGKQFKPELIEVFVQSVAFVH